MLLYWKSNGAGITSVDCTESPITFPPRLWKIICIMWSSGALAILFEHLGSCLVMENSMMKSSVLFEYGPLPSYVHLTSTWHHSRDKCSQAFPVFRHSSVSKHKLNNENRRGLGTRLIWNWFGQMPEFFGRSLDKWIMVPYSRLWW